MTNVVTPYRVFIAGMHRGGRSLLHALDPAVARRIASWTVIDPKPGRAVAGAQAITKVHQTAYVTTHAANAELILASTGTATDGIVVTALDTPASTRAVLVGSVGAPTAYMLIGRSPGGAAGTCFGLAGFVAGVDDETRASVAVLLETLDRLAVPSASSRQFTAGGDLVAASLLAPLRRRAAAETAATLCALTSGDAPMSRTVVLLPNGSFEAGIHSIHGDEDLSDRITQGQTVVRALKGDRRIAIGVDPVAARIFLDILDRAGRHVGVVELVRPPRPKSTRRVAVRADAVFTD